MNITSTIWPIPHESDMPMSLPPTESPVISSVSSDSEHPDILGPDTEYKPSESESLQPFSQVELNDDLTRNLGLSKGAIELLSYRLKEKTYLPKEALFIATGIAKKNML